MREALMKFFRIHKVHLYLISIAQTISAEINTAAKINQALNE